MITEAVCNKSRKGFNLPHSFEINIQRFTILLRFVKNISFIDCKKINLFKTMKIYECD